MEKIKIRARAKIRILKSSDFKELCKNELSYYNELKKDPLFGIGEYKKKITKKEIRKQFLKRLRMQKSGKWIILIAENNKGKMIGEISAQSGNWVDASHMADIGYSVIKEYRKQGIASAMMKEMIRLCKKKYETLTASFFSNNTASKALLKKFGFKKWGYGPKFAKRGKIYLDNEFYYLKLKS